MAMKLNWTECSAMETAPGKMAGHPVIRGTRVRPQDLLVNREEGLAWLSENFSIPVETIREVLAFHDCHQSVRVPSAG
jgi:uncharacterized protein (DUF433 family)